MRFILYSPVSFEPWDWRNSVETGIGGSETSHVEMAWRLRRRGHEVITYTHIPDDCPGEWLGTQWKKLDAVDWDMPGIWVLYRCPKMLDNFSVDHPGKQIWLMNQDWHYPDLTEERAAKLDRMMVLCEWHKKYVLEHHPYLKGKIMLTSNGLKPELVEATLEKNITRNPYRVMFASSADRGLQNVIKAMTVARESEPRLELHVFYGFNNARKLKQAKHIQQDIDECEAMMRRNEWITFHGRVSQVQLYEEWAKSGMWVYRTDFRETSCITCMEAQALGAIPIVSPVAALDENVMFGVAIEGLAGDNLTGARFAMEIVKYSNEGLQKSIRPGMMKAAKILFDWERFVSRWETEAEINVLRMGEVDATAHR